MKKDYNELEDELRPEYHETVLKDGVRGKYPYNDTLFHKVIRPQIFELMSVVAVPVQAAVGPFFDARDRRGDF